MDRALKCEVAGALKELEDQVLTSAAHILKLKPYRESQPGPCAGMMCKFMKCTIVLGFPGGSVIRNLHAMQETQVQSQGREDPLVKGMATHSSILDWRIPWTEEPGRLQSMRSQRDKDVILNTHQADLRCKVLQQLKENALLPLSLTPLTHWSLTW